MRKFRIIKRTVCDCVFYNLEYMCKFLWFDTDWVNAGHVFSKYAAWFKGYYKNLDDLKKDIDNFKNRGKKEEPDFEVMGEFEL